MTMPLFANALWKQNAAKEEHRRRLQAEKMQADAADAVKERGRAWKQRELYTHPGLPSSGEEASRMLGRPLPLSYVEVAYRPFRESDVRDRPKTKASRRKAGGRVKAEKSASSVSETPADPALRREPRVPRVEEADTGEELVRRGAHAGTLFGATLRVFGG